MTWSKIQDQCRVDGIKIEDQWETVVSLLGNPDRQVFVGDDKIWRMEFDDKCTVLVTEGLTVIGITDGRRFDWQEASLEAGDCLSDVLLRIGQPERLIESEYPPRDAAEIVQRRQGEVVPERGPVLAIYRTDSRQLSVYFSPGPQVQSFSLYRLDLSVSGSFGLLS